MSDRTEGIPRGKTLFEALGKSVQEVVVQKLKGSKFGLRLATIYLGNYTDMTEILDHPELVDVGAGMVMEKSDDEARLQALITIGNDMRVFLALISEAQKTEDRIKVFPEEKIAEVLGLIVKKVKERNRDIEIRESIEGVREMVYSDLAARLRFDFTSASGRQ